MVAKGQLNPDWKPLEHPRNALGHFVKLGKGMFLFGHTKKATFKSSKQGNKPLEYSLEPGEEIYASSSGNIYKKRSDGSYLSYLYGGGTKEYTGVGVQAIQEQIIEKQGLKPFDSSPGLKVPASSVGEAHNALSQDFKIGTQIETAAELAFLPKGSQVRVMFKDSSVPDDVWVKKDEFGDAEWYGTGSNKGLLSDEELAKIGNSLDATLHFDGAGDDQVAPDLQTLDETYVQVDNATVDVASSAPQAAPAASDDTTLPESAKADAQTPQGALVGGKFLHPTGPEFELEPGQKVMQHKMVSTSFLVVNKDGSWAYQVNAKGQKKKAGTNLKESNYKEFELETPKEAAASTEAESIAAYIESPVTSAQAEEPMPEWEQELLGVGPFASSAEKNAQAEVDLDASVEKIKAKIEQNKQNAAQQAKAAEAPSQKVPVTGKLSLGDVVYKTPNGTAWEVGEVFEDGVYIKGVQQVSLKKVGSQKYSKATTAYTSTSLFKDAGNPDDEPVKLDLDSDFGGSPTKVEDPWETTKAPWQDALVDIQAEVTEAQKAPAVKADESTPSYVYGNSFVHPSGGGTFTLNAGDILMEHKTTKGSFLVKDSDGNWLYQVNVLGKKKKAGSNLKESNYDSVYTQAAEGKDKPEVEVPAVDVPNVALNENEDDNQPDNSLSGSWPVDDAPFALDDVEDAPPAEAVELDMWSLEPNQGAQYLQDLPIGSKLHISTNFKSADQGQVVKKDEEQQWVSQVFEKTGPDGWALPGKAEQSSLTMHQLTGALKTVNNNLLLDESWKLETLPTGTTFKMYSPLGSEHSFDLVLTDEGWHDDSGLPEMSAADAKNLLKEHIDLGWSVNLEQYQAPEGALMTGNDIDAAPLGSVAETKAGTFTKDEAGWGSGSNPGSPEGTLAAKVSAPVAAPAPKPKKAVKKASVPFEGGKPLPEVVLQKSDTNDYGAGVLQTSFKNTLYKGLLPDANYVPSYMTTGPSSFGVLDNIVKEDYRKDIADIAASIDHIQKNFELSKAKKTELTKEKNRYLAWAKVAKAFQQMHEGTLPDDELYAEVSASLKKTGAFWGTEWPFRIGPKFHTSGFGPAFEKKYTDLKFKQSLTNLGYDFETGTNEQHLEYLKTKTPFAASIDPSQYKNAVLAFAGSPNFSVISFEGPAKVAAAKAAAMEHAKNLAANNTDLDADLVHADAAEHAKFQSHTAAFKDEPFLYLFHPGASKSFGKYVPVSDPSKVNPGDEVAIATDTGYYSGVWDGNAVKGVPVNPSSVSTVYYHMSSGDTDVPPLGTIGFQTDPLAQWKAKWGDDPNDKTVSVNVAKEANAAGVGGLTPSALHTWSLLKSTGYPVLGWALAPSSDPEMNPDSSEHGAKAKLVWQAFANKTHFVTGTTTELEIQNQLGISPSAAKDALQTIKDVKSLFPEFWENVGQQKVAQGKALPTPTKPVTNSNETWDLAALLVSDTPEAAAVAQSFTDQSVTATGLPSTSPSNPFWASVPPHLVNFLEKYSSDNTTPLASGQISMTELLKGIYAQVVGGATLKSDSLHWTSPEGMALPLKKGWQVKQNPDALSIYYVVDDKGDFQYLANTKGFDTPGQSVIKFSTNLPSKVKDYTTLYAEPKVLTFSGAKADGLKAPESFWTQVDLAEHDDGPFPWEGKPAEQAGLMGSLKKQISIADYPELFQKFDVLPNGVKHALYMNSFGSKASTTNLANTVTYKLKEGHYDAAKPEYPWNAYVAKGQTSADDISAAWPLSVLDEASALAAKSGFKNVGSVSSKTDAVAAWFAASMGEKASVAHVKLQPGVNLHKNGKKYGGMHSKTGWTDAQGEDYISKAFPNDPNAKARVDAEHAGNVISRMHGLTSPETQVMIMEGKYSYLQHLDPATGDLDYLQPNDLNDSQLIQAMETHVLDWVISNHDTHGGNLMVHPDGKTLIGIDKGQAFKFFPKDKLAVGYLPPGNGAPVWFDRFYYAVKGGKISQERADLVMKAVLKRAHSVATKHDKAHRAELEFAVANRTNFPNGWTREQFVDKLMERKHNAFDDFHAFYGDLWKQAGWKFDVPKDSFKSAKVEGTDAYVAIDDEFLAEVQSKGVIGKSLMFKGQDLEDQHALVYTTKVAGGGTNLRGDLKLRADADAAFTAWLKSQTIVSMAGAGAPAGAKIAPTLPGQLQHFDTITQWVKTVNYHLTQGDTDYNAGKVQAGQDLLQSLQADLSAVQKWQDENPGKLYPQPLAGVKLANHHQQASWIEMSTQNIASLQAVQGAMDSMVKYPGPQFKQYVYTEPDDVTPTSKATLSKTVTDKDGNKWEFWTDYSFTKTDPSGKVSHADHADWSTASKAQGSTLVEHSEQDPDGDGEISGLTTLSNAKVIKVTHRKGVYTEGKPNGDNTVTETNKEKGLPNSEMQYDIEYGNVIITYQPRTEPTVTKTHQGLLQFKVKDWDGTAEQLEDVFQTLREAGVPLETADEESMELFYWQHMYGMISTRTQPKASHKDVIDHVKKNFVPGMSAADELKMLKEAWAKHIGQTKVDQANWRPQFSRLNAHSAETTSGRPYWIRPDVSIAELRQIIKADKLPVHNISYGNAGNPEEISKSIALNGNISSEERVRVLGKWNEGASSSLDQSYGASSVVFWRQNMDMADATYTATLEPKAVLRTHNYSFAGDQFGNIATRDAQSAWDPKVMYSHSAGSSHGGNEIDTKNAASMLDDIAVLKVSASARTAILAKYKEMGITEIRGLPVGERIVSNEADRKATIKKVWDMAIKAEKEGTL